MATKFPNLMALRAFDAVVRHKGIAGAAQELSVTPSAISHRLRQIEAELGLKLFRREGRRLALTKAGERLAAPLSDGLEIISQAISDNRNIERDRPLTISMLQNIAVNWFLPRLSRFTAKNPDIEVRLLLTAEYVDFHPETADMAIRYSTGPWPDLHSDLLLADRLTPLCSPSFLAENGPFRHPRRLRDFPLITSNTRTTDDWSLWFRSVGVETSLSQLHMIELDSTHLSMQAAANGLGFAIAGLHLAEPMLSRGVLIAPINQSVVERSRYYCVCPVDWRNRDKIKRMRNWLLTEATTGRSNFHQVRGPR